MVSPPNSNPSMNNPKASAPRQNHGPQTNAPISSGAVQNSTSDSNKKILMQQQLFVLIHAKKCRYTGDSTKCAVKLCAKMKEVLKHMEGCNDGKECQFAHCASSQQIIKHWMSCERADCTICLPLRRTDIINAVSFPTTFVKHLLPPDNKAELPASASVVKNTGKTQQPESQKIHVTIDNIGEKKKFIQQQLFLLLHAKECLDLEHKARCTKSPVPRCTVNHCSTMKGVLKHMNTCRAGRECQVAHCASSHQILAHWRKCKRNICSVCRPVTNSNSIAATQQKVIKSESNPAGISTKPAMHVKSHTPSEAEVRAVESPAGSAASVVRSTRLGDKVVPLALLIQFKQLEMIMKR